MNPAQKEAKSKLVFTEINSKLNEIYESSIIEAGLKYKIVQNMDCNLSMPEEDQTTLTKIISFLDKFLEMYNKGKNFLKDCLLPPFELEKEYLQDDKKLRKAKIDAEIQRAKEAEKKQAALNPEPEGLLSSLSADPNIVIPQAVGELKALDKIISEAKAFIPDANLISEYEKVKLNDAFYNEDLKYELSESNPSLFANEMKEKTQATTKKVGEFANFAGNDFKTAAAIEVDKMIKMEKEEYAKNPANYAMKVSREMAKYAASPKKYGFQTIIRFGSKNAVDYPNIIPGKQIEGVMTERFKNENPYSSLIIDHAFQKVEEKHRKKLGLKARFKEINKSLSKSKSTIKTNNEFLKTRIKFYLENKIRGFLSNKLSEFNFYFDLNQSKLLAAEIGKQILASFMPFIKKFACGIIVKLVLNFFGPGAFKYISKIQQIYAIVKEVYNAVKNDKLTLIEKWSLYGKSIGMGINLFTGDNTLPICRRKLKKFK